MLTGLALLVVVAVMAAACGDDDSAASDDVNEDSDASETDAGADGDVAFPVTVAHKYGDTTIPDAPERVVSVGYTDQDFLLALDVVPVAIRDWYGDQPFAVWPWAQDELGDAEPEVLPAAEINFEQIAALQPDLIVGVSSGMTEEEYRTLSDIAPTLTQSAEFVDYGMPWQEALSMIGDAVGKADEASSIIDELESTFAEIRESYPTFTGEGTMSYVVSETEIGAYASSDSRSRVLSDLGFTIPPEIDELAGDSFYSSFSLENLAELDRDLLVWILSDESMADQIRSHPLHDTMRVVQDGAEIFLSVEQAAAAGFNSPLSMPYFLETFVPQLEAAMDDDPATEVPAP